MAWQIAAAETAIAKQQFIEKEQLLIGICSLEKVLMSFNMSMRLKSNDLVQLKSEFDSIEIIFKKFNVDSTKVRRKIREIVGKGNFEHTEKVVHRSENSKKLFSRACELAKISNNANSLHLFAAILEDQSHSLTSLFQELDIGLEQLRKKVLFYADIIEKGNNKDDSLYI